MSDTKNTLDGNNSKLDIAEEKISEFKGISNRNYQKWNNRKKNTKKMKEY